MPQHKNQHYVPRCYLRAFSSDGAAKAINLHNLRSARSVNGAPMKSQCSAPYVYGKEDLGLEHAFGKIETTYGTVLNRIRMRAATDEDLAHLVAFMTLQHARTKAAMERTRSAVTGTEEVIRASTSARLPEIDTSDRATMLNTLAMYMSAAAPAMSDLKSCLVRNRSGTDFVVSDDPVCFTSRFHAARGIHSFSVACAGALFLMPLTPRLLLLTYDGSVYRVRRNGLYAVMSRDRDAEACNELQYLNAYENVYFSDWAQCGNVKEMSAAAKGRRPDGHWRFARFKETGPVSDHQRYQRMATGERMQDSMLIAMSRVQVLPQIWPSIVRFRYKQKYVKTAPGIYRRPGTVHVGRQLPPGARRRVSNPRRHGKFLP